MSKVLSFQQNFDGSNPDGLFTLAVSKLVLESLGKNSMVADLGNFRGIFSLKMVHCNAVITRVTGAIKSL